jgi:TPR repeat protein
MDISKIDPWIDPAPSNADTMTVNKLRQQIKKKKPWAYVRMAARYEMGGGVKKSLKKAIDHYKKGMKLGAPRCMNELGHLYRTGKGVAKNEQKAFEHFQMAAFKGYDHGQLNLGLCYIHGTYVEKNATEAREWFSRAAAQGDEDAINELTLIDEEEKAEEKKKAEKKQPQIIQVNQEQSIKSERSRASISPTSTNVNDTKEGEIRDTKDIEIVPWIDDTPKNSTTMTVNKLRQKVKKKKGWAMFEMSRRYEYGAGGAELSAEKAVDYLTKGTKLGDPKCTNQLGVKYDKGNGVAKNAKLAFEHYQMAAFKGHAIAQFNLGTCYDNGDYVEQSDAKAREWYNRAAQQGLKSAIQELNNLDQHIKAEEEEKRTATEEKEANKEKAEEKESQPQIMKEEKIKSEIPSASTSPTSTNINNTKEGEIKDTKDIEIAPWIDDTPRNSKKMTLNKIRQKVKKKKLWAINELGRRYEYGDGVELSAEKAVDYYKKGTEMGDPICMTALGYMYEKGEGVAVNAKLAFEQYQMAALKGFDLAQFNLGICYDNGDYVEQSNAKAREWYTRAAAQGDEDAVKQLKLLDEEEKEEEEERQPQIMQEKEEKEEQKEATTPSTTVTKKKHRLYCLNCRRPYTNQTKHMFRRCSMCCGRDAIFCGPLCQQLTWPDHREECIRIGIILHNY